MGVAALISVLVAVFGATLLLTGLVLIALRRRAILDHPNTRSSHTTPTPRGGGLAVIAVALTAWLGLASITGTVSTELLVVCAAAVVLAGVSWWDDLRGLPAAGRFAAHAAAVAAVMAVIVAGDRASIPLPVGVTGGIVVAGIGVAWLWFVNLFNFMDGIDGLAGGEAFAVAAGAAVVAAVGFAAFDTVLLGGTLAAAVLGFLAWNWAPARIFLGDVGSIPLGFLLGWLMLRLAADGAWAAALILPLYFLADATLTLLRRTLRGARIWEAHREHFYQRAVDRGWSHDAVARWVMALNLALAGLAVVSVSGHPWPAIAASVVLVALLMVTFAGSRARIRR